MAVSVTGRDVLLSLHGLPPAQIAALVECDPATVRRWIGRFNACGVIGDLPVGTLVA